MRGDLSNVFSYDTYFQYGRTNYTQVYKNEFSVARLNRALNAVNVDANGVVVPVGTAGSTIVCRSVLDNSDPTCVPYDPFGAAPSAAAVNYLNVFGVIQGITSEQIANFNVTGLLGEMGWKTPWAEDGIAINAGVEYRRESLELNPDTSFQTGDLTGQGAPTLPVSGNFKVWEVFGEVQMPIVQNSFIDELTLSAGYRKSWYTTSNDRKYDTDTYKLALEFAPIQRHPLPWFVQPRGSRSEHPGAVRAAVRRSRWHQRSVRQGHHGSRFRLSCAGPCVGQSPSANPAGQYNGLLGGNPNLTPEKGTTIDPRYRDPAALHPEAGAHGRLVGHQAGERDPGLRRGRHPECLRCQSTATFTSPACDLVAARCGGFDLADSEWLRDRHAARTRPTMRQPRYRRERVLLASAVQPRQALLELRRNADAQGSRR